MQVPENGTELPRVGVATAGSSPAVGTGVSSHVQVPGQAIPL